MQSLLHRLLTGLVVCATCLVIHAEAFAQAPVEAGAAPGRPRVGLVLSGGGARGVAHVGVLRSLEQMRIPIDAIAGTSMGAVVGGLYASGMTAAGIERELASLDWEDAFEDRPERRGLNFRRKREDADFLVQFPLGFRDGQFQLPSGLIQGQKLSQLLRELTLPVAAVGDFDHLPTPFRAVATDLETGNAVVMGEGDLATALRASLSAPGIFAPVERDGRLLVDGGISNNLPIDVARAMGVDVLIVVDVGLPLETRDRLGSVTNVANQMLTILVRRESEKQLATLGPDDVLVSPDMPRTSSYRFSNLRRIIGLGTSAADRVRERLQALAMAPEPYERYVAARQRKPYSPLIQAVSADESSARYSAAVDQLFGDLAGSTLQVPQLRQRISRFYGQGLIESLDYRLLPSAPAAQESADLQLSIRPNSWGPNYVRFGLRLQDDFDGNSTFDAAVRVILTDINHYGAEWVWDGQLGGNPRIGSSLYLPLSLQRRWFLEPAALFEVRAVPQFEGDEQVGELRVRSVRYGGSIGREIGNAAEFRLGAEREIGRSSVRLGDTRQAPLDFQTNTIFSRLSFDSLDSAAFPRRGEYATLEWRGQVSDRSLERVSDSLELDLRVARSWDKNTLVGWVSGGSLLDAGFADARSYFTLGGFLNLSGRPADSLIGPHFGVARLVYYRKVGSGGDGFLNVPMYAGMSVEVGNVWERARDVSFDSAHKDMSLFFGLDTFLGPAWFAVGYDSAGRHAFYLSLGRGF